MKASKVGAVIFGIAAVVLLVLSVIERDGGILWMPGLHIVGWFCLMIATALLTYTPEDAAAARARIEAEAAKEANAKKAA